MSIEPTCDFCGYSDKTRCKTTSDAAGCLQYKDSQRATRQISAAPKATALDVQISMTINGPKGPITVKDCGETISVQRRDDDPLYLETSEVDAMIACLGNILQSRK